jgi:hypothetical protein
VFFYLVFVLVGNGLNSGLRFIARVPVKTARN